MNYLQSLQHYQTGYEEGRRQAESDQHGRDLLTTLFVLVFKMVFLFIHFGPGILSAYLMLAAAKHYTFHLAGWIYAWIFISIVFALECMVYFLKGWAVALKQRGSLACIIPSLIIAVYGFALPVYMLHFFIYTLVKPAPGYPTGSVNLITWVIAGVLGIYIYSRYYSQRVAIPRWAGWAYRVGKGHRHH